LNINYEQSKQLIQVTYASSKDEIEKREIKSLIKASELLKCKDLLVIIGIMKMNCELKIKLLNSYLYGNGCFNLKVKLIL